MPSRSGFRWPVEATTLCSMALEWHQYEADICAGRAAEVRSLAVRVAAQGYHDSNFVLGEAVETLRAYADLLDGQAERIRNGDTEAAW